MKMKRILMIYLVIFAGLLFSSCFNIFSFLAPGEPENASTTARLMAIGEQALAELDYETAYDAFSNVVALEPTNSVAIERMCTAYLFMKMPITNVILALLESDYGRLDFNVMYEAANFISTNMYPLVNEEGDGVIPNDDMNLNLNFFVFNSVYAAFFLADTDGDDDVQYDTNDFFVISNDFSFSNRLPTVSNFVEALGIINFLNAKVDTFNSLIAHSEQSLNLLSNVLRSTEGQDLISNVRAPILDVQDMLVSNFADLSNLTSLVQFGLSNDYDITNLLAQDGYTNYDDFTNALADSGITNLDDLESQITNVFPDLTNLNELISNFYGL